MRVNHLGGMVVGGSETALFALFWCNGVHVSITRRDMCKDALVMIDEHDITVDVVNL
jgi:hypothetical protein